MNSFLSLNHLFLIIGCLILGAIYAGALYYNHKGISRNLKLSLTTFRFVLVALIAYVLVAPLIKQLSYKLQKPIVIIGQDNSLSIKNYAAKNFNQIQYEADFKALAQELSTAYDVKVYNFGDSINEGFNFKQEGKLTNASEFVKFINNIYANQNVGAVILATDGLFNQGGNPIYDLNKLNAAVYSIALGDTLVKRDLVVSNMNFNNIVNLDDEFTVEVQVQAFESIGENTKLRVHQGGVQIYQQVLNIKGNATVENIPIKLKANKVGVQKYTFSVSEIDREITVQNNSQSIYLEVIDGKKKVLLATAFPHPDLSVIKEAIQSYKPFELKLAVGDELNRTNPSDFDLVIMYQLPDVQNFGSKFLNNLSRNKRIPQWFILGAQSNLNALNDFQEQVDFMAITGSLDESYPVFIKDFSLFANSDEVVSVWDKLDPLQVPFTKLNFKGLVSPLFNQRIGQIKTSNPMWFFTNDGNSNKMSFLMGEGLWRWRLNLGENNVDKSILQDLIVKTVQYLTAVEDKRKFKVFTSKTAYQPLESVLFNATLYNDSYEPINTPDVNLILSNNKKEEFKYLMGKTEKGYLLNIGDLPSGEYKYKATTSLNNKNYEAEGAFYVDDLWAELQQTTANHQLLNTISAQSNGKLYEPQKLKAIADEIAKNEQIKTISYEQIEYNKLIQMKWLFFLILSLLTLEWFLRKRNGAL